MDPKISKRKYIPIHSKTLNGLLLTVAIFHEKDCLIVAMLKKKIGKINQCTIKSIKFSAVGRNRTPLNYVDSWLNMPDQMMRKIKFSSADSKASLTNKLKLKCEFICSTGEEINTVEMVKPCSFKFPEFQSDNILSCIPSGKLADCPNLYKDLWDLYSKRILCDVELKTQSASFWVHKVVLCARSHVFLAMFCREMKKKTDNCVEIEDLGNDTLQKFISFLYTDSFEESEWNTVAELYYAADKYQVERLKYICCSYFINNMDSVLKVCELLILADEHSDSHLKSKVEDYIVRRHEGIFRSSTWKEFAARQPLLALNAMQCRYDKVHFFDSIGKEKPTEKCKLLSCPSAFDDFRYLYESQTVSDTVIQTSSATFSVHKIMLFAGSSTLRELLESGKPTDSLKMEDLEVDTVSRLLLFLYTDSLRGIKWKDAAKLYHAAFAYQIERLKIKCTCFFLENLETSNAASLLRLAHEHGDIKLKSLVEDFVSVLCTSKTASTIWKEFHKLDQPKSIDEAIQKIKIRK